MHVQDCHSHSTVLSNIEDLLVQLRGSAFLEKSRNPTPTLEFFNEQTGRCTLPHVYGQIVEKFIHDICKLLKVYNKFRRNDKKYHLKVITFCLYIWSCLFFDSSNLKVITKFRLGHIKPKHLNNHNILKICSAPKVL